MKISSAKQKGRKLQQKVRDMLLAVFTTLEKDDIRSTSMGAPGEDILFSPAARRKFPFTVECKNVEKLNIWEAINQARGFENNHTPAVVFCKNGEEPFIAIPFSKLLDIYRELENKNNSVSNN